MRTLKKWLKNTTKKDKFIYAAFCVYFFGVLWLTLLNRKVAYSRQVMKPFWSYRRIANGDLYVLKEDIENIALFIPFGYLSKALKKTNWKQIVVVGFLISLQLETIQYIFKLGFFEIDDLVHNTVGVSVGIVLFLLFPLCDILTDKIKLRRLSVLIIVVLCSVFTGKLLIDYHTHQKMVQFASFGDTEEYKNLLVLNGKQGYAWNTDVYIKYKNDGKLHIKGYSEKRSWWPIGELVLNQGYYRLTGLEKVPEKTVAIELEHFDKSHNKFVRYLPDLGPNESIDFRVRTEEKIIVYVTVYPDVECDVFARPVIYRLGE